MTAKIIDGKVIASEIRAELKAQIAELNLTPGLAVILVGEDPASQIYVAHKTQACNEVGIRSNLFKLNANTTEAELLVLIDQLNHDKKIHGILVQLPLPKHLNTKKIMFGIDPKKDVDGFHPLNIGALALREPILRPCTSFGIIKILKYIGTDLIGKNAVVVGASNIVGRPMALELLLEKATVTICHRFTKDLSAHVSQADILISAIGQTGVIKSDWIKSGAIVIDVGMNRDQNHQLCGDLDFETAKQKTAWITPVPGGVGPLTVAMLLHNTVRALQLQL